MASKDKRSKGCPNEACECNKEKRLYKADDRYCVKCGTELMLVCRHCFKPLHSDDPSKVLCAYCQAEKETRKQQIQKMAAATVGSASVIAAGGVGVARKYGPQIAKGATAALNVVGKLVK